MRWRGFWKTLLVVAGTLISIILFVGWFVWILIRGGSPRVSSPNASLPERVIEGSRSAVFDRVLDSRVKYDHIEHVEGTTFRIMDTAVTVREGSTLKLAELEVTLDPSTMAVVGAMDLAPHLGIFFGSVMPIFQFADSSALPAKFQVDPTVLMDLKKWMFSLDALDRRMVFHPDPAFKPVPVSVSSGSVSFENNQLVISGLSARAQRSKLIMGLTIQDLLTSPSFKKTTLSGLLDFGELLIPVSSDAAASRGKLEFSMELGGALSDPEVRGTAKGSFELPRFPVQFSGPNTVRRQLEIRTSSLDGTMDGGPPGSDTLLRARIDAKDTRMWLSSLGRRLGFEAKHNHATMTLAGSWGSVQTSTVTTLTEGAVNYVTLGDDSRTWEVNMPFSSLSLSSRRGPGTLQLGFDGKDFLGGNMQASFKYLPTGKVPGEYSLKTQGLDLAVFSKLFLRPQLTLEGRLTVDGGGTTEDLKFIKLRGEGTGSLSDLQVVWRPASQSLAELDIADLIAKMRFGVMKVTLPVYGDGVSLSFSGSSPQGSFTGEFMLTTSLRLSGRLSFDLAAATLDAHPGVRQALRSRGLGSSIVLALEGVLGQVRVALLGG